MNALLLALFYISGILLHGNGLPYGDFFSKYETRDDYYEDYYLRKIPKPKTSPDKIKQFIINHLSWFPVNDLENGREDNWRNHHSRRRDDIYREIFIEASTESQKTTVTTTEIFSTQKMLSRNITKIIKKKVSNKMKNFTSNHHIPTNWTSVKNHSSESIHKMKDYVHKKHFKEIMKNVTHPLRYRGPMNHTKNGKPYDSCDDYLGPNIRIHPKSSHVEVIKKTSVNPPTTTTTTSAPLPDPIFFDSHFSIPRKIKVIIDLKGAEKSLKSERKADDKYVVSGEADNNSTKVLETAGEMASDLAGKVTNLWHCVVGQHRSPEIKDVRFYLYTRRNIIKPELLKVNYDLIQKKVRENIKRSDVVCIDLPPEEIGEFQRISDKNREIIKSNFLNLRAPTKILIHGYTGSYKDNRMAKIKDAYLSNGRYNVIQVDWEALAAPPCYIKVTHHSNARYVNPEPGSSVSFDKFTRLKEINLFNRFVGETVAQLLNGLHLVGLNMSLVHLVGFSLGAQVAGFTGNNITIAPVCRITGLDPALPLFLHTDPAGHLDKFDAKFVDVIHTCGGILAMLDPLGHVDFYPNGGTRQPGCEFSNLKCSHSRAPQYFAESIVSKKKFTGQLCLNWDEYLAGDCNNVTDISFMGEPCSRKSISGKYYLMTKSKEPFVL